MAQNWSRVLNTTTRNYIRERENNTLRNRKLPALLKKKGRISYGWSGTAMDWKVQYKKVKAVPFADGDTLEFSKKERYKTATLDWRGYSSTDGMSKMETLQNRGKEAIIKLAAEYTTDLMNDAEEYFHEEFFLNGLASGNSKRLMGLESFFGATANPGNIAATPTSTYAGLSCVPGAYNGTWDGGPVFGSLANFGWPNGRGDAHFDFWSPLIVDFGDTALPGGATNGYWRYNCTEAIAFALIKSKKSPSLEGKTDLILMDDEMYRIYLAKQRAKERIDVTRKSTLVELGFDDVINQDGTDITWEYGISASVGYGLNISKMELRSMQDRLWVLDGPRWNQESKTWSIAVDFFGNLVFNPKYFFKLVNLTNPTTPM